MSLPPVVPVTHDPLPHLLSLHNRADAILTALDAAQMRASVLASSFRANGIWFRPRTAATIIGKLRLLTHRMIILFFL